MITYEVVNGPSKYDLMLGLFEDKELLFWTDNGKSKASALVRVSGLTRINDDHGHNNHWEVACHFKFDGPHENYRECKIEFWLHNRTGSLTVTDARPMP